LKKRVLVLTGATSGIGYQSALLFARKGWSVYGCGRNREKLRELEKEGISVAAFDLSDIIAARSFIEQVLGQEGRVDVLLNNAGFGLYGAVEDVSLEEARNQFDVNLFGAAEMIRAVLPSMRGQKAGRIINVSSMAGIVSFPLGSWYHASKHAMEGFSDCLRQELSPLGIKVILVEPGAVGTRWPQRAMGEMGERSGERSYALQYTRINALFRSFYKRGLTPVKAAQIILKAALSRYPRRRYVFPVHARLFIALRRWGGALLWDFLVKSSLTRAGKGRAEE